jgi:signal transduction histidine kinase
LKASIFIKLIAIVIFFGILLNLSVIFVFKPGDDLKPRRYFQALNKKMEVYIVNDIGVPPDTVKAKEICSELGIRMSFQSPNGSWASDDVMPSFREFMDNVPEFREKFHGPRPFVFRHKDKVYSAIPQPGGIFVIEPLNLENIFRPERAVITVLILISFIIIALYFILRWLFKPMKELSLAVKQIGEGKYDVALPVYRKDELGELASSINDMSKKIGYSIKAKEQLLIDVSHELRTPLTRIKLGLEVNSPKEKINDDIVEMERMISGLLESYKTGNYLGELKVERSDITALLQDTIDGFLENERIKFTGNKSPVYCNIDSEKIDIVFRNLLDNALKYSTGEVKVSIDEQLGDAWITFTDKGQGIKEEDLNYIFEPFYRSDPSRSRKTGGFGLGLSICKKIIDAHKGEIKIDSKLNEGTVVILKLPTAASSWRG